MAYAFQQRERYLFWLYWKFSSGQTPLCISQLLSELQLRIWKDVLPRSFPFVFSCLVQCKDRQIIPFLVLASSLSGLDLSQSASLPLKIQGQFTSTPPVFSLLETPGYPQRRKVCCFLLGAPADSHQLGSLLLLQPATDI